MRICFVSHSAGTGGAERALLEAVLGLRDRGFEAYVLLPAEGPLARALDDAAVPYDTLPLKTWWAVEGGPAWRRIARPAWNAALAVPAALRIVRRGCDVVYSNTIASPLGAFAAKLARRPHVWHLHELGYEHNRQAFDLGLARSMAIVDRTTDLCLANSHAVAEKFGASLRRVRPVTVYQSVVVHPGDPPDGLPPRRGFRCAIVGALGEGKRQIEAVEAIAELRRRGVDADLVVVGEGDSEYTARLRRRVDDLGLDDAVAMLGYVANPFPVLESADAVLVCALHEGFGRVTVEGMLAGRPVVGARSGGTAELIEDGVNGALYAPGDLAELASVVERLARDPDSAKALGARAKAWAEPRFTRERYAEELSKHLREHFDPR